MQQTQGFVVGLTPVQTAARVARQRSALRLRLISAFVSLVILILITTFLGQGLTRGWTIALYVIWGVTTLFWVVLSVVGLSRAKRDLVSIGTGPALTIDADGISYEFPQQLRASWDQISALKVTGPNFGKGPVLQLEVDGAPAATVPVSFLDAMPSAIDGAVSAFSRGRVRLDVSDMDRML